MATTSVEVKTNYDIELKDIELKVRQLLSTDKHA